MYSHWSVCGAVQPLPLATESGVSVCMSQKRTVVSPEPDARCWPLGLKEAHNTASAWPGRDDVHLRVGHIHQPLELYSLIFQYFTITTNDMLKHFKTKGTQKSYLK